MGTRTPVKDGIGRIIGMITTLNNGDQMPEQWPVFASLALLHAAAKTPGLTFSLE